MKKIIVLILFSFLTLLSFAETIQLKSGKIIEGKVVEEADKYIKIDSGVGVAITYYLDEIVNIDKTDSSHNKNQSNNIKIKVSQKPTKSAEVINNSQYKIYIPSGIYKNRKYPLVVALSPSANAQSMIDAWQKTAEEYKWIVLGSKEHRNGMDMKKVSDALAATLRDVFTDYPVDKNKIVATGFSGGAMSSHAFSFYYPDLIKAIILNTGMIHEIYLKKPKYPRNKIAVFLASPSDFRYNEMKRDKNFLNNKGWDTSWIEFKGGHKIAPVSSYKEAAKWLKNRL